MIWAGLVTAIVIPVAAAAASPLLAYRQPVYIVAGFAGILAMTLLLIQPLLAGGLLPGLTNKRRTTIHRTIGSVLVLMVAIHVGALWVTSPPDAIDALTFNSPTAFSPWGVVAMWTVFAAGLIAALRYRLRLRPPIWRLAHTLLVTAVVVSSIVHAVLIEGTMEPISKIGLCSLVFAAQGITVLRRWAWSSRKPG